MRILECVAAVMLALAATPVLAGDALPALAHNLGIIEVRGGLAIDDVELFSHAPIWAVPRFETIKLDNLDTLAFDVLFASPEVDAFKWIGAPRPVVGVDLNIKHESMLHAALDWHFPIGKTGFFIEPEVGAAIHDGALRDAAPPMRNLGCRALFFWGLNIGYQINDRWSIMASEQHGSQAGFCGWEVNQGLNYESIRIGYKF